MKQLIVIFVIICAFSIQYSTQTKKLKQYGGYPQGGYSQGGYQPGYQGGYQGGYQNGYQGGYPNYQQGYNNNYNQPNYNYNQPPVGQRTMRCNSIIDCMDCGSDMKQCHLGTCFCCRGKTCFCQKFK
jgi:hypothetical protein